MDEITALVEKIERRLDLARQPAQSRLPTERKLAAALGVKRSALRRALA
ncbi:MAG: GntR family transcriptional regulator, partial [Betaproteobacteria bacterium]|nr:GntR family transcriptional regulator [Betaproteobacteria bacterium]